MKKTLRTDQVVLVAVGCLVGGYLLGIGTSFLIWNKPAPVPGTSTAPVPVAGPGNAIDLSAETREVMSILEKDPKQRSAWVRLGNLYFDSNQYMPAIEAYTKALELEPNDPDVITDRAVMYRAVQDFQRAAAEFRRASEMDPRHLNSLMNLGIVLRYDLNDVQGAVAAWQAYLARNPPPEQAEQVRRELASLQSQGR